MESSRKSIVLIAGEDSGDMHGAHLVKALKHYNPSLSFSGLGGPQMQSSGVELYRDLTKIAVVGFWEVIKHYSEIKKTFHLILEKIDSMNVDAVVLIDYPGFNLRLAKELKKRNIKVIYYISPQVWAWKKNRIFFIKKFVDKMLVLFKFEENFYAQYGINVHFVGHPLVDIVKSSQPKEDLFKFKNLSSNKLTIGILPGSREKEIEHLLPRMISAAKIISNENSNIQFLIIKAPSINKQSIKNYLINTSLDYRIIEENSYDGINACDICMVASGTATLETALLQKPMVIVYRTSLLTWLIAKLFVTIKNIGLVNVVAGKQIVPECIQFQATGQNIADELKSIINSEEKKADIKANLRIVKEYLGSGNASDHAAKEILQVI